MLSELGVQDERYQPSTSFLQSKAESPVHSKAKDSKQPPTFNDGMYVQHLCESDRTNGIPQGGLSTASSSSDLSTDSHGYALL